MKEKSFNWQSLYLRDGRIAPSKALIWGFLGLHLLYGLLHFPLYLAEGYGTVLPTVISLVQAVIYPLTAVICFVGVLGCMVTKFGKNNGNPIRFWYLLLAGEAISSFLVALIERLDVEYNLYYWYVILGNILLDTILDVLYIGIVCVVLHLIILIIKRKSPTEKHISYASMGVGILCGLYLFASEIVTTIYFFLDVGWMVYLNEVLYILLIYAVYGMAGFLCYWLTFRGVTALNTYGEQG